MDKHEECREHGQLCEDCIGEAIDDAMDKADLQRDYDEGL
jgi:hypothetical protein